MGYIAHVILAQANVCLDVLRMVVVNNSACFKPIFPTLDVADEADGGASGLCGVAEDVLEARLTPQALVQGLDGLLCLRTQA